MIFWYDNEEGKAILDIDLVSSSSSSYDSRFDIVLEASSTEVRPSLTANDDYDDGEARVEDDDMKQDDQHHDDAKRAEGWSSADDAYVLIPRLNDNHQQQPHPVEGDQDKHRPRHYSSKGKDADDDTTMGTPPSIGLLYNLPSTVHKTPFVHSMPPSNKDPTRPEGGGVRDVSSNHPTSTTQLHVYYHFDRHKPIGNRFIMGLFNTLMMLLLLLHHHIHLPKYYTIPSTTIIPLVVVATSNLIFTTVTATAVEPLLRDDDVDRLRESYDGHLDYEAHVGKYFGGRTGVWIKRLDESSSTDVIAMYQGVTYHFKDTHKKDHNNENDWIKFNINKR
ncbi:hypothetical protein FOZ62_005669, partial [Perkinsus olseni]